MDRLRVQLRRLQFRRTHPLDGSLPGVPLSTHLAFVGVFSVLLTSAVAVMALAPDTDPTRAAVQPVASITDPLPPAEDPIRVAAAYGAFDNIALEGDSAIVVDLSTGEVLYQQAADEIRPLASVTKLMTAVVAAERLPTQGQVAITYDDLAPEGESMLVPGDRWDVNELLAFTLLTSSNDGARALASAAGAVIGGNATNTPNPADNVENFIDAMNTKARLVGMTNSAFDSDTGLDISYEKSGAYGTARDVATLLSYILKHHPSLLDITAESAHTFTSGQGIAYAAENTNKIARNIPGLWASKTGFTDLAGGNLAVIVNADLNRPIAIVVLGSTTQGRFVDIQVLAGATRAYFGTRYP